MRRICPNPSIVIVHQSHYTAIINTARVKIIDGPKLKGPMTKLPNHKYRMCQYVVLQGLLNSAAKPMQVFNIHLPGKHYWNKL